VRRSCDADADANADANADDVTAFKPFGVPGMSPGNGNRPFNVK